MRRSEKAIYLDEYAKRLARDGLLAFVCYCFRGAAYLINWHNELICEELDDWLSGRLGSNLIIQMPPRCGKSELVSRMLPAYIFGKNPDASIIATSYSGGLVSNMSRDCQRIMSSPDYAQLFPNVKLAKGRRVMQDGVAITQTSHEFEIIGHRGHYMATSIGSSITGYGADFGIIDDPLKGRAEAESKNTRDKVWDWYRADFRTRLEKGAKQIILLTRWHEDDLVGRLLQQAKEQPNADRWHIISLPALYRKTTYSHPKDLRKEGEPLWPEKYDTDALMRIKATQGTYDWEALYQQEPKPPAGAVFQLAWIRIVPRVPRGDILWVRFWDFAVSADPKANYTAGVRMGKNDEGNYYIDKMIRGQWIYPDVHKIIVSTAQTEIDVPVGVESQGTQKGFADDLIGDIALEGVSIEGYTANKSKLVRALPWFRRAEAGKVFLIQGDWNRDFIDEVIAFTGKEGGQDDQVDAVSGAFSMLTQYTEPEIIEIGDLF